MKRGRKGRARGRRRDAIGWGGSGGGEGEICGLIRLGLRRSIWV